MKNFILNYYPIILAFISFLLSVSLWFTGNKLEGIFVGIWVPSILAFSIAIRQRRNDLNKNYVRDILSIIKIFDNMNNDKLKKLFIRNEFSL